MLYLHAAVDVRDRLKAVLSQGGVVVFEWSADLPSNPTPHHYAAALRQLANSIEQDAVMSGIIRQEMRELPNRDPHN